MTMVEAEIKQWGNSLCIIIPKHIIRVEDLRIGDTIKIEISKEKRINGFGMFKGIPSFKEEEEPHGDLW